MRSRARDRAGWRMPRALLLLMLLLLGGVSSQKCGHTQIAWPASQCTVQCPTSVDGKGRTVDPCAGDSRVPSTTVCQLCTSASRAYRPAPPGRPRRERDHVGLLFVPKAWAE